MFLVWFVFLGEQIIEFFGVYVESFIKGYGSYFFGFDFVYLIVFWSNNVFWIDSGIESMLSCLDGF